MSDNIDFKALWAKQISVAPPPEQVLAEVKKIKRYHWRKLLVTNVLLIATSLFIIFIWVQCQPQWLSTKIGIVLTIVAMAVFLFAYNKSYGLFKSDTNAQSNSDYLKDLLSIKAKQQFMETTMLNLYFILLSLGIGLYMYEYTSRMKPLWGFGTYGLTFLWILFNWFYVRPKQIKKQRAKLEAVISKLESVNEQLKG